MLVRTRHYVIAGTALLIIWMMMPGRNRTVVSTAPDLSGTFNALSGVEVVAAMPIPEAGLGDVEVVAALPAPETGLENAEVAVALPAPETGLAVLGAPTITVSHIERVLEQYHSPAVGHGQEIYDLGIKYGINPAISLAFFVHESSAGSNPAWAGWKPDGTTTHNVGNIICTPGYNCYGRFRDYPGWHEGIEDWYILIKDLYIGEWGRTTVEDIIPKYAPASDNNDENGYINVVKDLVHAWQQEAQ